VNKLNKNSSENDKKNDTKYICQACPYIYDEEKGDPEGGIPPGTPFEEIPDDWVCPICLLDKTHFELLKNNK
jgi:rubredoxin